MAERVATTNIKRKDGYLYFCKGNPIEIWEAKQARGRKKKV